MTIPRLPGVLDGIIQGVQGGYQAYDQQRALQYAQAQQGAGDLINLILQNKIDPIALGDPAVGRTLDAAKIPRPPAGTIIPSVPAEAARQTVEQMKGVTPGSTMQRKMLNLPTFGEVSEDDLRAGLNSVKQAALSDPSVARLMAEVMTPDVAQNIERSRSASAAGPAYDYAAENFVSQAALAVKKGPDGRRDLAKLTDQAYNLASKDPEYSELVSNGQLSKEYFAKVAARIGRLDEEELIKFADIAARRAAAEKEARYYYDAQRKSYDTEIGQLQASIKQNAPSDIDKLLLTGIQKKIEAGQPLNAGEQLIMQKVKAVEDASARIESLTGERADIRDRFIGRINPIVTGEKITPPSGAEAAARRGGKLGASAPQAPARKAGESDADYWERLKASGLSPEQATAKVRGSKP